MAGAGGYKNINASAVTDYWLEMAKGNITGHSFVHKFGRNDDVPNGTWEGVLQVSAQFNFRTAAETVRVKSGGDAADTAAGAGAQAITIIGLNGSGVVTTEIISLAGTSASSVSTNTYQRVYRMYIADLRAGAYGAANTADIVLENGTGGTDLIKIAAGEGQTQYGAYTISAGKTGYVQMAFVKADAAKAADFRVFTRTPFNDNTTPFGPKRLRLYFDGVLGYMPLRDVTSIITLPELTDIWVEARGGGANTEVSIDFNIVEVDN